ncbi:hypothetical protein A2U01_0067375, partial [Trifolium medium]|nr:hypothetical protein [Trifolium medium]
ELIKSGHLRKFLDDAAQGKTVMPKQQRRQPENRSDGNRGEEKVKITVNTIAGGFAGGGE